VKQKFQALRYRLPPPVVWLRELTPIVFTIVPPLQLFLSFLPWPPSSKKMQSTKSPLPLIYPSPLPPPNLEFAPNHPYIPPPSLSCPPFFSSFFSSSPSEELAREDNLGYANTPPPPPENLLCFLKSFPPYQYTHFYGLMMKKEHFFPFPRFLPFTNPFFFFSHCHYSKLLAYPSIPFPPPTCMGWFL